MNCKEDLILNWLKNIKWDLLSDWERDFVDGTWVDKIKLTQTQKQKLLEIYNKYRFSKKKFSFKPEIGEYAYIHDFDK